MGDRENKKILLVDIKKCRITEKLKDACISMGFEKSNIFVTSEAEAEDFSDFFEYYYVTAGNTFEILKEIRIKKLSGLIKRSMFEKIATYIGSSEVRRYIKNTDSDVLAGYDKIYSVNDNEALIGEFEKNRNVDFQRFSITR